MKSKHIVITIIIGFIFAAVAAFMLLTRSVNVMNVIEGQNTFLSTATYFASCMAKPAGLLTWCGAYLTQFLHNTEGIYLLCAMWFGVIALTAFTMKLPVRYTVLATIPAAMLLAANVGLEYWIFYLKSPGYVFTATIGIIVSLLGGWLIYKLRQWGIGAILSIALYPLFGIYGLLATALGLIFVIKDKDLDKRHKFINYAATAVAMIMPIIWYATIYHLSSVTSAYTAGIPMFQQFDNCDNEQYVPYFLLFAYLAVMTAFGHLLATKKCNKAIAWIIASIVVISAEAAYIEHRWYNDDNYNCELQMLQHVEKSNWQGVISTDRMHTGEPTRAIVMMRDLALFKTGRLSNEAFTFRNGGKKPESAINLSMLHIIGPAIYYHYGKMNYCNRWLIEHAVDYGWSHNSYKYLIKCATINGEKELAEKYANILKDTRNYNESEEVKIGLGLSQESNDMKEAKSLMTYNDFMGSDQNLLELFLLSDFANDTTDVLSIKTLALHAIMTQKDMRQFWPHFYHYIKLLEDKTNLPLHIQEAAYLLGRSKNSRINVEEMPFDQRVIDTYNDFANHMGRYNDLPIEAKRQILKNRFDKTYYYYYYLEKNFDTY